MIEEDALLTGEMSGHMFFRDEYFGFDDAIYASCRLLRILSNTDQKIHEILATAPKYYATPEIRADCPDNEKFGVVKEIVRYFKGKYKVIDIDGARVLFEDGWGLVRASNTQPVIVVRCEAKTKQGLEKIKKIIGDKLREYPSVKLDL
jgi:phosphomannomutase/phosphoglucomutase